MNKIKRIKVAILTEGGTTPTGTFYATKSLAEGLKKRGLDIHLITSSHIPNLNVNQLVMKWPLINVPFIGRISWFFSLYFRLRKYNFDIIHSFGYGMMNLLPFDLYKNTLKITTLGDVMCDNKEFTKGQFSLVILAKVLQPPHIRFNDLIITYTEDNKQKIAKLKKVNLKNIKAIPLALENTFKKVTNKKDLQIIRKKYDLPKRYIFHAGNIKANKNIINMIRAFKILAEKDQTIELIFSGKLNPKNPSFYQKIISNEIIKMPKKIKERIRSLNYVSYEELPAIYTLSSVFLMPSLEEGFGVPLLEAMNCEVPIVTSNISSMPEIVKESGLLCNPRSPTDIATQLRSLLSNQTLRKRLIENGKKRSKYFTQDKTSKLTYEVYLNELKKKRKSI